MVEEAVEVCSLGVRRKPSDPQELAWSPCNAIVMIHYPLLSLTPI